MYSTITEARENAINLKVYESILYAKTTEQSYKITNEILPLSDGYIPIGLYVVPQEHVGDGKYRFMSLRYMSTENPDTGVNTNATMYWGNYGIDLSLPNLAQVPKYLTNDTSATIRATSKTKPSIYAEKNITIRRVYGNFITGTDWGCLPSDKFTTGIQNPHNANLKYFYQSFDSSKANYNVDYASRMVPAPFLTDETQNVNYKTADINANALGDFNGISNTNVLVQTDIENKYAANQPNWLTDAKITNSYDPGYSPAACCCKRFNPDGFTQGQWYLPACGELGYVCIRQKKINTTLSQLRLVYSGVILAADLSASSHCTSSEYTANYARRINFNVGFVGNLNKNNSFAVLAFVAAE